MTDVAIISEEIIENSQNINNIRCQFCNSLILCKESGKFTKSDVIKHDLIAKLFINACFSNILVQITADAPETNKDR